jgi:hypothetical protein
MSDQAKPLFVRLATQDAERLDAAVAATGKSKRQLVGEAVRGHFADEQMPVGRITLHEPVNEVMTLAQAALFLHLEEEQLRGSAAEGEVPARQIAGEWRFSRAALLSWLDTAVPSRT